MPDNIERLREEGFTINMPMPDEYETVLRDLSDDQVATLITVKRRLDEAQVALDAPPQDYVNYFLPF